MTRTYSRTGVALACAGLLTIAGCGGGGGGNGGGGFFLPPVGGTPGENPPPSMDPVTLSGAVISQGPVSNAVVCVDRNANNACDEGEPLSAKTGIDGAYTLTYVAANQAEATALAAAPLVAQLTPAQMVNNNIVSEGASFDAFAPVLPMTFTPLSLSAPAGKPAQINPLTTLVQAGVASGLALDRVEASVALQLGIPAADIYSYQGQNTSQSIAGDNAQTMALVTLFAIGNGVALRVIDPTQAPAPVALSQLASFSFTDVDNYSAKLYPSDNVVDPVSGQVSLVDRRFGKTAGVPIADNVLYDRAYLAPAGWTRCTQTTEFTSAVGTPNRSSYCNGASASVGYSKQTDISGRTMESVVSEMQASAGTNTLFGIVPSVAFTPNGAVFPAESTVNLRTSIELVQPHYINNTAPGTADKSGFTNLEAIRAARLVANVNLTTGAGTQGLGPLDATQLMRFAYVANTGDAVQYYRCDSNPPAFTAVSNCTAAGTGTATISAVNGARVLEFTGQPNAAFSGQTRGYTEYDDGTGVAVWQFRKSRPELNYNSFQSKRLNGPASSAMFTALGITAPN